MLAEDISRRALNLSLAIYRLSGRLPKGEALVGQLRKIGNEVVGDLVVGDFVPAQKKIKVLLFYFKIGQAQNWVRAINWQILNKTYRKLYLEISILKQAERHEAGSERGERQKQERVAIMSHNIREPKKEKNTSPAQNDVLSRHQKILTAVKAGSPARMSDLSVLFQNVVSARTLRNDLVFLIKQGLINKKGTNKYAVYYAE